MEASLLEFLLGTSVAMIATLVAALGISLRRNGHGNPNMETMDAKLNEILVHLAVIVEKLGGK